MTPLKGHRGKGPSRAKRKRPGAKKKTRQRRRSKPYTILAHPADVGFVVRGKDLPELFANAALALCDYGWELGCVKPVESIQLRVRAATLEDLVFSWLSEVLFLSDAEGWVFKQVGAEQVRQASSGKHGELLWEVTGTARGEKFHEDRHQARTYIKAVTYHQLAVKKTRSGWQAQVFLDV
jgi:SHS2 domain-containing protein